MLVLGHHDVRSILDGRERDVLDAVRNAYTLHEGGRSAVPHSVFLRFPGDDRNRIIGLPAYLADSPPIAGMKWVASFPGNLESGLPRASAVMVLNSAETGRPEAFLEGSLISARRTGASAALAGGMLCPEPTGVSLIGCGVINFEVLRFLRTCAPTATEVTLYDTDADRRGAFADRCRKTWPELNVTTAQSPQEAMARQLLVSIATTAVRPHLDITDCRPGTVILHVSLRDFVADAILNGRNIVDDPDHVSREGTSVHLAEQATGNRDFIHGTIGQLILGEPVGTDHDVTIVSPFGLGILDLAVAELVVSTARQTGLGVTIPSFLP